MHFLHVGHGHQSEMLQVQILGGAELSVQLVKTWPLPFQDPAVGHP